MKLRTFTLILISFGLTVSFQNCAPTNFVAIPERTPQSLEAPTPRVTPFNATNAEGEIFEVSVSSMAEQADANGSILLSGTVGANPMMAEASDANDQIVLVTGMTAILAQ